MILAKKVALVYGAGPIGDAVAKAFVREGARVFLANRSAEKLDKIAAEIKKAGGTIETTVLDAHDQAAVKKFVDDAAKAGGIDISFNAIGYQDIQKPLMEITVDEFLQPITNAMRTQFLTTRAAVDHMIKRGGGVVLAFGGSGPQTAHGIGGFKIALDAIEGLRRQWSVELGEKGIRVITLKTGGIGEAIAPEFEGRDQIIRQLTEPTLLKRLATLADVGNVAAFMASDMAGSITATEINISCGAMMD